MTEQIGNPTFLASAAAASVLGSNDWKRAGVHLSKDDGESWLLIGEVDFEAAMGVATTRLGSAFAQRGVEDSFNSVTVEVQNDVELASTTLSKATALTQNYFLIGDELLVALDVTKSTPDTIVAPTTYVLRRLHRGLRDTWTKVGDHVVGEPVVQITATSVAEVEIHEADACSEMLVKFVPIDSDPAVVDGPVQTFTPTGANLVPLQPGCPRLTKMKSGDVWIEFDHRTRLPGARLFGCQPVKNVDQEKWTVEVMDADDTVKRKFEVTQPFVNYTSAMQTADWTTARARYKIRASGVNSFSQGNQRVEVVDVKGF